MKDIFQKDGEYIAIRTAGFPSRSNGGGARCSKTAMENDTLIWGAGLP